MLHLNDGDINRSRKLKNKKKSFVLWSSNDPESFQNFHDDCQKRLKTSFSAVAYKLLLYQLDDNVLVQRLAALQQDSLDILDFSTVYQCKGMTINGFSTFADNVTSFLEYLIEKDYFAAVDSVDDLHDALKIFISFSKTLIQFHKNRINCNEASSDPKSQEGCSLITCNNEELEVIISSPGLLKNLVNFHQKFFGHWLRPGNRLWISLGYSYIAFTQQRFPKYLKVYKRKHVAETYLDMMFNGSKSHLKALQLVDSHCASSSLRLITYNRGTKSKTFWVPCQGRWTISGEKVNIVDSKPPIEVNESIRCRFIENCKVPNEGRTLVFYCHGGGMITTRPEVHEMYLKNFVAKMDGASVLCPDYTLKALYPIAFQDLLDVYLWVTSGNQDVKEKLGFYPERIVIAGDSAGGLLGLGVLNLITKIMDSDPTLRILLPDSLVFYYGAFLACSCSSPAKINILLDMILTMGPIFIMAGCVTGHDGGNTRQNRSKSKIRRGLQYISDDFHALKNCFTTKKVEPWYKTEDGYDVKTMTRLLDSLNESLFNSFYQFSFERFSSISLYLFTTQRCIFLDDNIELVKLWKGPVELHIGKNLVHGFLHIPGEKEATAFARKLLKKATK